ncbi:MAG: DNA repair exonuclease [Anaerolineae bacterium]
MRFLHIADVHLGNQQYNVKERFNDFGRAFFDAVDLAITRQADAVVIAGDLFHKAAVEPGTLLQAEEGLKQLKKAGIVAVGVHGNHDRAHYLTQTSWLEYLCEHGLICLLAPDFETSPAELVPWSDEDSFGSYVDVGPVRFVGVPWLGAAAPRVLAEVSESLAALPQNGIKFTVLVTHAGVEGQMPNMPGGLRFSELEPLKAHVHYLALGHLHKPYQAAGWIYNPGSLETCSFDEAVFEDRGCYLVEVSTDGEAHIERLSVPRRPFFTLRYDTHRHATPEALLDGVTTFVQAEARKIERAIQKIEEGRRKPIVRLVLQGNLTFDRAQLDLDAIRNVMRQSIDALLVRVENRTVPLGLEAEIDENTDRAALERQILEGLIRGNTQFNKHTDTLLRLSQEVMHLALQGEDPANIFTALDDTWSRLEEGRDVD